MIGTKEDLIKKAVSLQKQIARQEERIDERDRVLTELHQHHHMRQVDIASHLTKAAESVGGKGVTEHGVFKAIRRTLGRTPGKVSARAAEQ